MSMLKNFSDTANKNPNWFAEMGDVHSVENILYENMDPFCEQIPDIEEIAAAIENHQILAVRQNSELAALLFFERAGVSATLKFWAVRKKYQGMGFGRTVYERYIATNADAKRWLLWVRDDNFKVKQIYEKYGMNYDNLQDAVWLRKP